MRRSLLNKRILPKPLRQALVLITLLLLPSAAWGERYTTGSSTGSYNNEYNTWTVNDASGEPITNSWSITATSTLPTITYNTETGLNIAFSTNAKQANLNFNNNNYGAIRKLSIKFKEIPDGINPYSVTMKKDESTNVSWTSSTSGNTYTYIVNPASSWESITIFLNYTGSQESADLTIESISFLTGDDGVTYYDLSVSDTEVTNLNASDITGSNISNGKVSFTPTSGNTPATLTLNGATITGDIIKSSSEDDKALIINLEGNNILTGSIAFNSQLGDLTFTGDGSLAISSEEGVLSGIKEFNASGFYLATDHPAPFIYESGYYLCAVPDASGNDWSVKQLTISKDLEVYPIWVYNKNSGTGYTQVTKENKGNVLSNNQIAYNNETPTLTLTDYTLTTTGGSQSLYAFYIGKDLKNMTVNLVGNSTIGDNDNGGSGFAFEQLSEQEENASLTFTTSKTSPGSLTVGSELTDGSVTVNYSNGLGYTISTKKVSTDWTRLIIGETPITGNATTVEGYSNVSFDDETSTLTLGLYDATNTLTLGGVTIGTQNSTNTDIDVYIKDLTVEISGINTVYGRFFGFYEENGNKGTITFKKKSGAETANLTISGLGDDHGPVTNFASSTVDKGLYLSGIDTSNRPVSSLSYNNGEYYDFDNPDNQVKEVLITSAEPGTKLWIGGKPVTSDNAGNVFAGDDDLDGKVSYDVTNQTLSLNGATIEDEIISNVGTLTIDLTGSNSINSISASGNATALAFTGDGDGTLTLKNSDGIISNFSSVDTGDFNLLSNSTPGIHWNATSNKFMDFANSKIATELTLTKATVYPLWVAGAQVTEANKGAITGLAFGDTSEYNTITGTVKFTPDDENELLLDGAMLTVTNIDNAPAIVSGLDNLKIKLKNRNDISYHSSCENLIAKSLKSSATLTFSAFDAEGELWTTIGSDDLLESPFESFSSVNFADQLFYTPGTGSQYIKTMKAPKFIHDEGVYLSSDDSYTINNTDIISLYYTINYVDESKNTETEPVLYNGELIVITEAATLTATAHYSYNGMESDSDPTIGKYFAIAGTTIVFNNDTKGSDLSLDNLKISPETEGEGIEFKFMSTDDTEGKVVSYDEQEKQWSIAGIGSCKVNVRIEHNEASIQVLNPENNIDSYIEISGNLYVLPDKPSIVKDAEHDYIETDKITITRTSIEGEVAENIKIFYIWSDDEVEVETYQYIAEGSSVSIYNPDEPIPAQTGTLRAWVGYQAGNNYYYNSEVVSEEFTVYEIAEMEWESESQTYGTYYNPAKDMAVPSGSTAYIVTGISEDGTSVTISPVSYIKAGVAVLIERDKTTEVSKTTDFSASKMEYSNPDTPAKPSSTDNWYVIYNNKFVKVTTGTEVKGGKCYLNLSSSVANTRGFYNIGDGEGTTAIREVKSEGVNSEKLADGEWYTLQGQRVAKPAKGLYIRNGKKVVVK